MTTEPITATNTIICGDCKDQLARIPEETVDLIYLDPPFFSGRNYEIIWKDGSERRSFEDTKFYTLVCECGKVFPENHKFCAHCGAGIDKTVNRRSNDIEAYLQWLKPRLVECRRVLKDTGSIYCHLDWHAVHYVKVMMDEIFDYKNFQNHIIWCYSGGGASKNKFAKKHDDILFYTKTNTYNFNTQYTPYKNPNGKHSGGKPYRDEGKLMDDWWVDLPVVSSNSKERLGYPTQKPETLLERIINASSNPGDVVLDPFSGCATAITVAQKLGRKWIGIDVSPTSCKLMVKRLRDIKGDWVKITESDIIDLPRTTEELRVMDPFEFQNWVMKELDGKINPKKVGDGGIDGWTYKTDDFGMRHKQVGLDKPVQVKRSDNISFPEIQKFIGAMQTDPETDGKRGIFVAFSFVKTAEAKLKKLMAETGISVELVTVGELLGGE